MAKVWLLLSVWGGALLLSFGLWKWGRLHPDPLVVSTFPVLALLFVPAFFMAIWLFWLARVTPQSVQRAGGSGESVQSDSEQEST
ncbi:possible NADH-Ubiquinone/plastoquinone (complex I) [Synechococcus sp. CC9311]|nr:possible NADH-Ubiquinone/plastoquinone (complex I) [Synechococcus sp. CC9311]